MAFQDNLCNSHKIVILEWLVLSLPWWKVLVCPPPAVGKCLNKEHVNHINHSLLPASPPAPSWPLATANFRLPLGNYLIHADFFLHREHFNMCFIHSLIQQIFLNGQNVTLSFNFKKGREFPSWVSDLRAWLGSRTTQVRPPALAQWVKDPVLPWAVV